ncbi:transposase [Streptomyces sp. NPDC048281]|uniref:transposase n=1 Tax=Streptomyces sp. NPDC048281 TaxID=3154715 RepID=UPI00342D9E4E
MLTVVNEDDSTHDGSSLIDEIVREGARRMPAAALEAEVNTYIAELADQRDENGRRLVVRNGYHQPRKVTTAAGAVEAKAPRVNDKRVDEATSERKAIKTFAQLYGAKFPKAVKKITDDQDQLLAFYDFPAEHWIHLRTTNPIESTFSTVRLRTKVTRGAGSRTAALAMVFKLVESAQARWRAVNAPHLVALVRAGARFERGQLVERPEAIAA